MTLQNPHPNPNPTSAPHGVLFVDKPVGKTSFSLVAGLRRRLGVKKIGHCGTLDPLASGLMVLLVGRDYTRLADQYLAQDKEYTATIRLGTTTDSYDAEGQVTATSDICPTLEEVQTALAHFQGTIQQVPPMFSAKKQGGKKLYELARKGITVERPPVEVTLTVEILRYAYPEIDMRIACTKGTYVRSVAHDLGVILGCGAHLSGLRRTRSGAFHIDQAISGAHFDSLPIEETLIEHTQAAAKIKGTR
jgi:tRNA pseudouridine55 synthase